MPRGGRRVGAGGQFKWKHGKTKTIRVPEAIAEKVLEYARKLDDGFFNEEESLRVPTLPVASSTSSAKAQTDGNNRSSEIIEHVTESKIVNLSGITIRACNGKSAVYLEDLVRAGYKILPERLGNMFKSILGSGLRR